LTGKLKIREFLYILAAISPSLIFSMDFNRQVISVSSEIGARASITKLLFLNFIFFHLPFNLFLISSILYLFAIFIMLRNAVFPNKRYLSAVIAFLCAYFILPPKGIDVRALLFSLIILSFSFRVRENKHVSMARLVLLSVGFIGSLWILISFSDFNKNFSTRCASAMGQGVAVLPIDVTKVESAITPYVNSWGYFTRYREMITPYLFSGFTVEYKKQLPAPSVSWIFSHSSKAPYAFTIKYNPLSEEFLKTIKNSYDYILLTGSDQEVKKLISSVSQEECSSGEVTLYKIVK
jgi:hypothetical protein